VLESDDAELEATVRSRPELEAAARTYLAAAGDQAVDALRAFVALAGETLDATPGEGREP
jgi:hypothetical protein